MLGGEAAPRRGGQTRPAKILGGEACNVGRVGAVRTARRADCIREPQDQFDDLGLVEARRHGCERFDDRVDSGSNISDGAALAAIETQPNVMKESIVRHALG